MALEAGPGRAQPGTVFGFDYGDAVAQHRNRGSSSIMATTSGTYVAADEDATIADAVEPCRPRRPGRGQRAGS